MDFAVKTAEQLRDHLRSLRKAAGLTQKELGVRLGLGQVRVAEIESNPGSVSTEQLLQVLQALDAELAIRPKLQSLTIPSRFGSLHQPSAKQLSDAPHPQGATPPAPHLPSVNVGARARGRTFGDRHADPKLDTFSSVIAEIAQTRLTTIIPLSDTQSHDVIEALVQHQTEPTKPPPPVSGDTAPAGPRPVMISPRTAEELAFWAHSFGVTTQELLDAIQAVGVKPVVQADARPNKGAW